MPSIYLFDASVTSSSHFITLKDANGNNFKISFDNHLGGLVINKTTDDGASDSIKIIPVCSNEIRIY
jgi:hypothetical protein